MSTGGGPAALIHNCVKAIYLDNNSATNGKRTSALWAVARICLPALPLRVLRVVVPWWSTPSSVLLGSLLRRSYGRRVHTCFLNHNDTKSLRLRRNFPRPVIVFYFKKLTSRAVARSGLAALPPRAQCASRVSRNLTRVSRNDSDGGKRIAVPSIECGRRVRICVA